MSTLRAPDRAVEVLYSCERPFMRKTFQAIDRHLDAESAYVPLREEAVGCWDEVPMVDVPPGDVDTIDETVRALDPDVVVENHRFRPGERQYVREFPVVHVRHGCSLGRGEEWNTTRDLGDLVDVALAPGSLWADHYREQFPDGVETPVVGVPEADELVDTDPPRKRRVLYAPTNHNYGGGSYVNTAEHVLDTFADSDYELRFRPHPMDRIEEPGESVTERCRQRIADLPNVTFDDEATPRESLLWADLLVSDYSGIVTEWLHTGRPLVQLTDVVADRAVPEVGHATDRLTLALVDELYEDGYAPDVERRRDETLSELGIPMDGRAGERAAAEVATCAQ